MSPEVKKAHFTVRLFEKQAPFLMFKRLDLISVSRELPGEGITGLSFVQEKKSELRT